MLSIGWSEMLVVAAVALIVVGPKDLPAMLRTAGQMVSKVRRMGNDFRREINRVAALDDVKEIKSSLTNPLTETKKSIESEFNKIGKDGKVEPSGAIKPTDPKVESVYDQLKASSAPVEAKDPVKTGAVSKTENAPVDLMAGGAKPKPAAKTGTAKKTSAAKAATKKPVTKRTPSKTSRAAGTKTGQKKKTAKATAPVDTKASEKAKPTSKASKSASTTASTRKSSSKAKSSESAQ